MRDLSIQEIDLVGGADVYYDMGHAVGGAYQNYGLPLAMMASVIPGWGFLKILS